MVRVILEVQDPKCTVLWVTTCLTNGCYDFPSLINASSSCGESCGPLVCPLYCINILIIMVVVVVVQYHH